MKKNIIKSLLSLILSVSMLLTGLGLTVHADVGGDIGEELGAGVSIETSAPTEGESQGEQAGVLDELSLSTFGGGMIQPLDENAPKDIGALDYVKLHNIDQIPVYPGNIGDWSPWPDGPRGSFVKIKDGTNDIFPNPPESNNYEDVPIGATVSLNYSFHLQVMDGTNIIDYKSGDYFWIDLPQGMSFDSNQQGMFSIGGTTASWLIDNGRIKVTFDGNSLGGVLWGEVGLSGTVEEAEGDDSDPIIIPMGTDVVTIGRKEEVVDDTYITMRKTGEYDPVKNEIIWTITIDLNDVEDLKDFVLEDTFSGNQAYVPGSFLVDDIPENPTVVNDNKITYIFPAETTGLDGTVVVEYRTKPLVHGDPNNHVSFTNFAVVKYPSGKDPVSDNDVVEVIGMHKKGDFADRTNNPDVLKWEIHIYVPGRTTVDEVKVYDYIGEGHTFFSEGDFLFKIEKKGDVTHTKANKKHFDEYKNFDTDGNKKYKLLVDLGTVSNTSDDLAYIKITYYTMIDTDHLKDNGWTASNHAWLTWQGLEGDGPGGGENNGIGIFGGVIRKWTSKRDTTITNPDIFDHAQDQYIEWVVEVNTNQMDLLAGTYVEDNNFPDQELVIDNDGHPFIVYEGLDRVDSKIEFSTDNFNTYSDTAYKLESTPAGYKLTFNNGLSGTRTLVFYTRIKESGLKKLYEAESTEIISFTNKVYLRYDENNFEKYDDATRSFRSRVLNKSVIGGDAGYNYMDRTVSWKVTVNTSHLPLKNATVIDTLPFGLVGTHITVNGERQVEVSIQNLNNENDTLNGLHHLTVNENRQFTITLGDTSDTYELTFKTYLTDEGLLYYGQQAGIELKNEVSLTTNNFGEKKDTAKITVKNPVITKSGTQGQNGYADYIDWVVELNSNQVDLINASVADTFEDRLELIGESVKLYKATVNQATGVLTTSDDDEVDLGEKTDEGEFYFTLTEHGSTEGHKLTLYLPNGSQAYILKFRTKLIDLEYNPSSNPITNNISLSGGTEDLIGEVENVEVAVNNSWALGGGGPAGFTLKKIDEHGNALALAKFLLVNQAGVPFTRDGEEIMASSGIDGLVSFSNLPMGFMYFVEEVEAPDGYVKINGLISIGALTSTPQEPIVIENELLESSIRIPVTKTVQGTDGAYDTDFTFKIEASTDTGHHQAGENIPMPSPTQLTIPVTGEGSFNGWFAPIVFKAEGTYFYKITEEYPSALGYNDGYDDREYVVKVEVTPDDEELIASWSVLEDDDYTSVDSLTFNNIYTPLPIKVSFPVKKIIVGHDTPKDNDKVFTFSLVAGDSSNPMPLDEDDKEVDTIQIIGMDTAYFETFTFTAAGTYYYTLTEVGDEDQGYINDITPREVYIDVVDIKGQLVATVYSSVDSENNEDDPEVTEESPIVFTNIYQPLATVFQIPVEKRIIGHPTPSNKTFTFTLEGNGDAPMPEGVVGEDPIIDVVEIVGADTGFFGEITYLKTGRHQYTVKETEGKESGYGYDRTIHTVTVVVWDNDGQLEAYIEVAEEEVDAVTFTNVYAPGSATIAFPIEKLIETEYEISENKLFKFELAADGYAPMPEGAVDGKITATITGEGKSAFPLIIFSSAGSYKYKVSEVKGNHDGYTYSSMVYDVTVSVWDTGGSLAASWQVQGVDAGTTVDILSFTNSYKPEGVDLQLPVTKIVEGGKPESDALFSFSIKALEAGTPLPTSLTTTVEGAGDVVFGSIRYTEPGVYKYKVSEEDGKISGYTYDETIYDLTVTVKDVDGKLVASYIVEKNGKAVDKIAFTNIFSTEGTDSQFPTEPGDESKPGIPQTGEGRSTSALGLALIVAGLAFALLSWKQRPRKRFSGQE